jgi:surfactin synthase thioesterase subunit
MAKTILFCIPYAGASARTYLGWKKWLSPNLDLHPIELAGRGLRLGESFYQNINEAVEDIYCNISALLLDHKVAFFGHSMGTILLYELLWKMKCAGMREPEHVFFSGRFPPFIEKK